MDTLTPPILQMRKLRLLRLNDLTKTSKLVSGRASVQKQTALSLRHPTVMPLHQGQSEEGMVHPVLRRSGRASQRVE